MITAHTPAGAMDRQGNQKEQPRTMSTTRFLLLIACTTLLAGAFIAALSPGKRPSPLDREASTSELSFKPASSSALCSGPEGCSATARNITCCCGPAQCTENAFDRLVALSDGIWTVLTRNDPKKATAGPAENRMLIVKIPATSTTPASLALINGVNLCNSTLSDLKALEVSEAASVRYVITPGDWHHVYLQQYNQHFPAATVYVPPGRIPSLEPALNYTLLDPLNPLPALQQHLTVLPMLGLRQPPPHLETVRYEFGFFHHSSGTLFAGDILFYWSCEPSVKVRFVFPGSGRGKITFWDPMGMSMILNKTRASESALKFLALPTRRFVSAHGPLGNMVSPGAVPSAHELLTTAMYTGHGPLA